MDEVVSAVDANRAFSRLLREVRAGKTFVITSHGKPIARIAPLAEDDDAARDAFREAYFRELETRQTIHVGRWTRDELYER